jgi:hypothetical protein
MQPPRDSVSWRFRHRFARPCEHVNGFLNLRDVHDLEPTFGAVNANRVGASSNLGNWLAVIGGLRPVCRFSQFVAGQLPRRLRRACRKGLRRPRPTQRSNVPMKRDGDVHNWMRVIRGDGSLSYLPEAPASTSRCIRGAVVAPRISRPKSRRECPRVRRRLCVT